MQAGEETYFQRLKRLLELEAAAEVQARLREVQRRSPTEAEEAGGTLIDLVVREEAAGLGGRVLLTLVKRSRSELPWTRLGVGSPVALSEGSDLTYGANSGMRGVVSRVDQDSIQVAFPDWPETKVENPVYRIDLASDEISNKRQRAALEGAERASPASRTGELRAVLLGEQPPLFDEALSFTPLDPDLNESQLRAIGFSLASRDLAVIHGPPGTGKTTTVVELIRQVVRRGETVLACAPSNLGVDNMLERLVAAGENVLRLGHPARVLPELREHTLDMLVENHPDTRLAQRLAREAYALRRQAGRFTRAQPGPGARQAMRQEASEMLRESRQIIEQVSERLLDRAQVLCATNTGLDSKFLGGRTFDLCVMDEAGQSTQTAAWIPLLRSRKIVLAGDPFQLPPTVISPEAAAQGFNISFLEQAMALHGPEIARRLEMQYRMHRDIMQFSSQEFYDHSQIAHSSVAGHLLKDLEGVQANQLTSRPIDFIDTAGASFDEQVEPDGESRLNLDEANLAIQKVRELLNAGLSPSHIAVIAPYAAQVRSLRENLRISGLEIDTVDGFQGREKEAVIVSLVRSNRDGDIGFLSDVRRTNVALTRARRKLVVIGDSATITSHPFYRRLVAFFEETGAYRSVWEEGI